MPILDSREHLIAFGFRGFTKICFLTEAFLKQVPEEPGLFAILREQDASPEFLELPQARALPPSAWRIDIARLKPRWITNTSVLYLGEASATSRDHLLRDAIRRLCSPSKHQTSPVTRHGQLVWYIRGSQEFEIAWCVTPSHSLDQVLEDFAGVHGSVPFANTPAA
jgi:hypothetical protein